MYADDDDFQEEDVAVGRMAALDKGEVMSLLDEMFLKSGGPSMAPQPFQEDVLDTLLEGTTVVLWEAPEGNAKSAWAAAVGLAHLLLVEDADVIISAASRDQATGTIFKRVERIVDRSPLLRPDPDSAEVDLVEVLRGYRRVDCPSMGGSLSIKPADPDMAQGADPTLVIIDEAHVVGDWDLIRVLEGKLSKQGGQMLLLSNAGTVGSVYETEKAKALEACDEVAWVTPAYRVAKSPAWAAHIWGVQSGADVTDVETVAEANPYSGVTAGKLAAGLKSPSLDLTHWSRMKAGLSVRVSTSAVSELEWESLDRVQLEASDGPVDLGMDTAWRQDSFALVPFLMPDPKERILGTPEILHPPRNGESLSFEIDVKPAFERLAEAHGGIARIVFDPNAQADVVVEWAVAEYGCELIELQQTNSLLASSCGTFLEAVRMGWMKRPAVDGGLTSHVMNAIAVPISRSHDGFRFDRPALSRHARLQGGRLIDALVAASFVHHAAAAGVEVEKPRAYDPERYRWTSA